MSFVSASFLVFVAIVFLLYYLVPPKYRWAVLLAGSYFYYAITSGVLILYIIFTTLTVYGSTMWMDALNQMQKLTFDNRDGEWLRQNKKSILNRVLQYKRWVLAVALLVNFGVLAFLKYYGFAALNLSTIITVLGGTAVFPEFNLLLPLGISFYTFQSLGYVIDVYRGKVQAERNPLRLALFVSFFPQIVQGPISRYDQLAEQLYQPHRFEPSRFRHGLLLMLWGFFKKLVIADRALVMVSAVIPNYKHFAGMEIGFAMLLFMVQIYSDFSGGMDIARGIAQCVGVDMVQNFERPHFAVGIADYWRRWHITLGAWMRDYLLYPLSLSKAFNRLGKKTRKWFGKEFGKIIPSCMAMSVVFLTVGIWHGAEWRHVAFGLYNGFFIVLGILLHRPIQRIQEKRPWFSSKILPFRIILSLGTCVIIFFSKYLAAADNTGHAYQLVKKTFLEFYPTTPAVPLVSAVPEGSASVGEAFLTRVGLGMNDMVILLCSVLLFFVVSLMQENGIRVRDFIARRNIVIRWTIYFILLFATLLFANVPGEGGNAFVYAQF